MKREEKGEVDLSWEAGREIYNQPLRNLIHSWINGGGSLNQSINFHFSSIPTAEKLVDDCLIY